MLGRREERKERGEEGEGEEGERCFLELSCHEGEVSSCEQDELPFESRHLALGRTTDSRGSGGISVWAGMRKGANHPNFCTESLVSSSLSVLGKNLDGWLLLIDETRPKNGAVGQNF